MDKTLRPLWLMSSPNQSGASFANRNLACGMVKIGITPSLFVLEEGESGVEFKQCGVQFRVFPHLGKRFFGGAAVKEAHKLGVNVVHALSPDVAKRGERLARKLNVPFLVTVNCLEENEIRSMRDFPGQGVVAVSTAIRERMVHNAGVAQSRIRVIHNGLDLTRFPRPHFPETADDLVSPWHTPVIGTLGHLSQRKGQRVFLQAVKVLVERGLDAEFVVLGDGPDRHALRNMAEKLHVTNRVTFTPQTVSGQLNQLDLLVEPSLQEGLGVSVMQAMAMGVPVVATGVGGLYDLIEDGQTGVMVPPNDPEKLADAIWRLLKNPAERMEMARQAREMIESGFSADRIAAELTTYYEECIATFFGWSYKSGRFAKAPSQ